MMHNQQSELSMQPLSKARDGVYQEYHHNSTGLRTNTDVVIVETIRKQYPNLHLTIIRQGSCDLLEFAADGHAQALSIDGDDTLPSTLKWVAYAPPARRMDHQPGSLIEVVQFGKFAYKWNEQEYILYDIVDGLGGYTQEIQYVLGPSQESTEALVLQVSKYQDEVHDEVLVFDGGYWNKSKDFYRQIQNASWDNVILDPEMKKSLIGVVDTFFNSQQKYEKLKVPWKRGIIYYGPPGNGKTISIKAMMNSLSNRPDPIPNLYVRSLTSYYGPEGSIQAIFAKARAVAPCFLVFEDLDSLISPAVRSYFLNEVDGLKNNDGILMVGSTNHIEQLDPGISKRPSRFDRKYLFSNPDFKERVLYCEFWRRKLEGNAEIEFPLRLTKAIAGITQNFSFAYIQEAFVAALLAIAGQEGKDGSEHADEKWRAAADDRVVEFGCANDESDRAWDRCKKDEDDKSEDQLNLYLQWSRHHNRNDQFGDNDDDDLNQYLLWRQIKIQIKILRSEIESSIDAAAQSPPPDTSSSPPHDTSSSPSATAPPPPGAHVACIVFLGLAGWLAWWLIKLSVRWLTKHPQTQTRCYDIKVT